MHLATSLSAGSSEPEHVASIMLNWHDLELVSCTELQTLWAGYGHICAISVRALTDDAARHLRQLYPSHTKSLSTYPLILKVISEPKAAVNPSDEGHLRKMYSYEVEQYFYSEIAPKLPEEVAVARCIATTRNMEGRSGAKELKGTTATIMTDLRSEFPVAGEKRAVLSEKQVWAALDWLGRFHRHSWNDLPADDLSDYVSPPLEEFKARERNPQRNNKTRVWRNGGYTYLATRQTEYAALKEDPESEWSRIFNISNVNGASFADLAAKFLTPSCRPFETYLHGDVKSENLFTTKEGTRAAFFDFQYIGIGLGVCDLAKLLTCSVPLDMLVDEHHSTPHKLSMGDGEKRLLDEYRSTLLAEGKRSYEWEEFERHWQTALVDWCRFQASWGFWGNTEWLQARVRSICADDEWRSWLEKNTRD